MWALGEGSYASSGQKAVCWVSEVIRFAGCHCERLGLSRTQAAGHSCGALRLPMVMGGWGDGHEHELEKCISAASLRYD